VAIINVNFNNPTTRIIRQLTAVSTSMLTYFNTQQSTQRCHISRNNTASHHDTAVVITDVLWTDSTFHHIKLRSYSNLCEIGTAQFIRTGIEIVTYEELYTLLTEIEACLNFRPLCALSNDPHGFTYLSPGHFLIGQPLTQLPCTDYTDVKINRLSRWQLFQQQLQQF
jgi:hypothetical protein